MVIYEQALELQTSQLYAATRRAVDVGNLWDIKWGNVLCTGLYGTLAEAEDDPLFQGYRVEVSLESGLLMCLFSGHYESKDRAYIDAAHSRFKAIIGDVLEKRTSNQGLPQVTCRFALLTLPDFSKLGIEKVFAEIDAVRSLRRK